MTTTCDASTGERVYTVTGTACVAVSFSAHSEAEALRRWKAWRARWTGHKVGRGVLVIEKGPPVVTGAETYR